MAGALYPRAIGAIVGGGWPLTITEKNAGTYTWKPTVSGNYKIECWAGGGGGGPGGMANGGGGGGGGAYARLDSVALVAGTSYEFTVGAGGGPHLDGADTVWGNGSALLAAKGLGATADTGALGGAAIDSVGDQCYSGGDGSDKITTTSGGGGGASAGPAADGGTSSTVAGGVAPAGGATGGHGATVLNTNGTSGSRPGAGGGGGHTTTGIGGSGAAGKVLITFLG